MAAKKTSRKSVKGAKTDAVESSFAVVLEDLRGQFTVFGEAIQGLREHMDRRFDAVDKRFDAVDKRFELADRRFDSVERQLGLLTDAVRTHSKALQAIESKLETHEDRVRKLEGAAE